ncbi:hypothetical protein JW979_04645 [bacterium]|nr:hypothetical protein [candidate division CSSED10-310 bacterium]
MKLEKQMFCWAMLSFIIVLAIPHTHAGKAPAQAVKVVMHEKAFLLDGNPMIMINHTHEGIDLTEGSPALLDKTLNVKELPEGQYIPLATQETDGNITHLISASKGTHDYLFIGHDGIIYSNEKKKISKHGPYLRLTLYRKDANKWHKIDSSSLEIRAAADTELPVKLDPDGKIIIQQVPRKPIVLHLKDKTSTKQWDYTFFPYFRGAAAELVVANIYDVPVGQLIKD